MGLFTELLLLPLAPVRGLAWTVQQLIGAAEREQISAIRRQLALLEQDLQQGLIDSAEFDMREDELLDQLAELEASMTQG